jgi:hypothetical protein
MSERAEPDDFEVSGLGVEPPSDDDTPEPLPVHRIVPAVGAERLPPVTRQRRLREPVSIFSVESVLPLLSKCAPHSGPPPERQYAPRIERSHGLVKLTQVRIEETAEWREREERRRAKQVMPRPPASWRRNKSSKLRRLLGLDLGD